ncbi:hypothetical protein PQX77_016778 [Marasmius sp. AFHP31]|nr:hypothetical protein PQX77_016778 [Marasmius sp. AFHP31]
MGIAEQGRASKKWKLVHSPVVTPPPNQHTMKPLLAHARLASTEPSLPPQPPPHSMRLALTNAVNPSDTKNTSTQPDSPDLTRQQTSNDNEQGSDDRKGSDSWRSASIKELPNFKERGRKPDIFTGKREEVEDFLMEFGRYLCLNEVIDLSASNKIDLLLSFIKHVWARHQSKEIEDGYANKAFADWRWKTWGDLRRRLREDFEPHDREETAEQKLDSLRQTGDLADIDKFNKVFQELA